MHSRVVTSGKLKRVNDRTKRRGRELTSSGINGRRLRYIDRRAVYTY